MTRRVIICFEIDEDDFDETYGDSALLNGDIRYEGDAILKMKCEEAASQLSGHSVTVSIDKF